MHTSFKLQFRELFVISGEKLIPGDKYIMTEHFINEYSMQMNLTVLNLDKSDFGGYICISSNALGKAEGVVRLQGKCFVSLLSLFKCGQEIL